MVDKEKKLTYDYWVEVYNIDNFESLWDIINIGTNEDIRENFIFRGLKKADYDLIPSSLRHNDKGEYDINKFIIDSEFIFEVQKEYKNKDESRISLQSFISDKSGNVIDENQKCHLIRDELFQFKREAYVLLKFLNYADKIGFKVPTSTYVRRRIHNFLSYLPKKEQIWPEPDFYEIISLAQHYGIPTRALDWSYDFKVALYFAVEDVLNDNNQDCVLWAFNYKLFEDNYNPHIDIINPTYEIDELVIYRPEYNNNLNLSAQKGLFTFLPVNVDKTDEIIPFDKSILDLLISRNKLFCNDEFLLSLQGYKKSEIKNNEKIFHKFVISGDLKVKILTELYKDGYAPENIFPSFKGVVDSIEKRVKLDQLLRMDTKI